MSNCVVLNDRVSLSEDSIFIELHCRLELMGLRTSTMSNMTVHPNNYLSKIYIKVYQHGYLTE